MQLGPSILLGLLLTFSGLVTGHAVARDPRIPLVRLVDWWISRVATGILRSHSTARRAAGIFLNNAGVLTVILATGIWTPLAAAGTFLLGTHLGIGFQIIGKRVSQREDSQTPPDRGNGLRLTLGMVLNMLEPPAIVLTLALALAWRNLPLSAADVWVLYATLSLPGLLLAAIGEGLWTGVVPVQIQESGPSDEAQHSSGDDEH
ncbi:MAG: hypothetical protein J5J06_01765 [Phycisphaerae bacterium]|nr:hypothetical protein [Phycisphaerae bacterium]